MSALIDRLPSELLSHIFATLVQSWLLAHSIGDDSYGRINYPILLSSICVRWRQVAITTPSLWSFLDLGVAKLPLPNIRYLNLCYERSAKAPLSVRFGRYDHECNEEAVDEQLASLLNSYAPRLDSLAISYWRVGFAKGVLSTLITQGAAGRVRKLALHAASGDKRMLADASLPQEMLDELLRPLRFLYLDGPSFDWNLISCRNLVELQLVELAPNAVPSSLQLVQFLNGNPTIRRLNMSRFHFFSHEANLSPIRLPELQSLKVVMSPQFMIWFFALLTPPSQATTLYLDSYVLGLYGNQVIDTFRLFFREARIVTLCISGSHWLPLSSIAAYLQYLEILAISQCDPPDYNLTDIYAQTEILPKLHTVELLGCSTRDVGSGLAIILFLPSVRRIAVSSFSSVDERGTSAMDIEQVREFMSMIGITATISESSQQWINYHPSPFV